MRHQHQTAEDVAAHGLTGSQRGSTWRLPTPPQSPPDVRHAGVRTATGYQRAKCDSLALPLRMFLVLKE